jgi:hypothetical protein
MRNIPRKKACRSANPGEHAEDPAVLRVRIVRSREIGEQDDINNRATLRDMMDRSHAHVTLFARCMGLSSRALHSYLQGTRRTPYIAVAAARGALIALGVPFAIPGAEIRRNLGIDEPWTPPGGE